MAQPPTSLVLRPVRHPAVEPGQAFRVLCGAVEVGSIGRQLGAAQRQFWSWGLDVSEPLPFPTHGEAETRPQAMARLKEAWELFAADAGRLAAFFATKAAIAERMRRWGPGD